MNMEPTTDERESQRARLWKGLRLSPVEESLMFHGQATLERFRQTLDALEKESTAYIIVGEIALAAYGSRRTTPDVTICVREEDLARLRDTLTGLAYENMEGRRWRFRDPKTQITVSLLVSGNPAGRKGRNTEVRFPDPADAVDVEGIRTVSLPRLIALRLVTWQFRGWAEVIDMIRVHRLDKDFAQRLPESTRPLYVNCYEQMLEEDRQEREFDQA